MSNIENNKVWFVTGTSKGLGRAIAEEVVSRGDSLVAAVRRPETNHDLVALAPDRVRVIRVDVTEPAQVQQAVDVAVESFGRIDVLVNNAGYGLFGGVEEVTDKQVRDQLEVNVFGVFNVTRAVLPRMRGRKSGQIFQISSVAGQFGAPGLSWYDASKFAVEGFSEALSAEAAPVGVNVTIVEPGNFRTAWAGESMVHAPRMEAYGPSIDPMREMFSSVDGRQPGDPKKAAEVLYRVLDETHPPLRLVLGGDALQLIRMKLERQVTEHTAWEAVTLSTDHDEV